MRSSIRHKELAMPGSNGQRGVKWVVFAVAAALAICMGVAQSADPVAHPAISPPQAAQQPPGTEEVSLREEEASTARKLAKLEQGMSLLARTGETERQRKLAAREFAESRRLLVVDQVNAVCHDLEKGQLYAAIKAQESLSRNLAALLDLAENSTDAKLVDIKWRAIHWLVDSREELNSLRRLAFYTQSRFAMRVSPSWLDRRTNRTWRRVLVVAGGPNWDYRYLIAHLARDRGTVVDALLQTAQPGTEQDVQHLLDRFPTTDAELAQYDAIVAFDPNWQAVDAGAPDGHRPTESLDRWVTNEAGGLIVAAGPVYTDDWPGDPQMKMIEDLYPVKIAHTSRIMGRYFFGGKDPGKIELTRDGADAVFLQIADSPAESRRAWDDFDGFYACYPAIRAKSWVTVWARLADPELGENSEKPILLASQPHGLGRVVYLGSAELWRLRSTGESTSNRLYDQLLHFASDGRERPGPSFGRPTVQNAVLAVDRLCESRIAAMLPLAVRLAGTIAGRTIAARMPQLVSRRTSLDESHGMVEGLHQIAEKQRELNVATRKQQRASIAKLGE